MNVKYPVGVETFSEIIEGEYAYVDKSEVIYQLSQSGKYFFLSRPRRFGKSLMLSTLEAYFEGRKELFDGLWLGQAVGVDWTPHPVLRMNFVDATPTVAGLKSIMELHLQKWERAYNIESNNLEYSNRFRNVIEAANSVTGQKVVVLIDEYDKALVSTMTDASLHEEMKKFLKPVFAVLKGADRYIRFAMLTGVSRFSKLSIFSDLNNLQDITFDDRYCTICGVTEEELKTGFRVGVSDFAEANNVSFEEGLQILKDNYDGYHFSKRCPDIYNPFSLINALDSREILHRWFESGTPTFLIEQIRNTDEDIWEVLSPDVSANTLANTSISDNNLISLLYQTGYLTIKSYDREDDAFKLGIPNREVEFGLYSGLLPLYSGKDEVANDTMLIKLRRALRANDVDKFLEILRSYLAGIPYSLSNGKPEIYYENNLFLIFKMLGFSAQVEAQTSEGRIDIALRTATHIYILELKLDGTPEEGLRQIEAKHYALPFEIDNRTITRIGINFSSQTRTIESWQIG